MISILKKQRQVSSFKAEERERVQVGEAEAKDIHVVFLSRR
jgi:hypothetical protein